MEKETLTIGSRPCISYFEPDPEMLLIQPSSRDEEGFLDKQVQKIKELSARSFIMVSFHIDDWNKELSPWPAPPVFGDNGFGDGAKKTLEYVLDELIPNVKNRYGLKNDIPVVLGGYSLAGLFSLWSMYETDLFYAVCGVSPSVWFEGWDEYPASHLPGSQKVYLSLGKKEEKTKNPVMSLVGDRIRKLEEILRNSDVKCILEWNEGGHFNDPGERCAKGFIWCLNNED